MISFAAALGSINVAGLSLLPTAGGCAAFAVVLFGLDLDRKPRSPSQECNSQSPTPSSAPEPHAAESSEEGEQQVIHLPANPVPVRSSEMSQQQKVAAALSRAGIAYSAVWSHPMPSRPTPAVIGGPSEPPTTNHSGDAISPHEPSALNGKLLLLGGLMLALGSLILFLALR